MTKKTIGILSGIGIIAVASIAIVVPFSLTNSDYVIPGKRIKKGKVLASHEYKSFKKKFEDQALGITDVVVESVNNDGKNLIVIATGKNKIDVVKVIFKVAQATGKTTVLEIEKGPSDTKSFIEDALKKNAVSNASKMKMATTILVKIIKNPDIINAIPINVMEAIKKLKITALNALSHASKKSSTILKSEILVKLHEALNDTEYKHLIKESHIRVKSNDVKGSMIVEIDGIAEKKFLIDGFLANEAEKNIKNELQTNNFEALKTALTGGNLTTTDKASDIAKRIDSATSLLKETGIDLTSLDDGSTYNISASATVEGILTISVRMNTTGAAVVDSIPVTHVIVHINDSIATDTTTKYAVLRANWEALNRALNGGSRITAKTDPASTIAKRINSVATLKKETDIDLTTLAATSNYGITASGFSGGKLTIWILMTTAGTTWTHSINTIYIIHHISDAQLFKSYNEKNKILAPHDNQSNLNGTFDSQTQSYYWAGLKYLLLRKGRIYSKEKIIDNFAEKQPALILQGDLNDKLYFKVEIKFNNSDFQPHGWIGINHLSNKEYTSKRTLWITLDQNEFVDGSNTAFIKYIGFKNKNNRNVILKLYLQKYEDRIMLMADINGENHFGEDDIIIKLIPTKITKAEYITKTKVQALAIADIGINVDSTQLPSAISLPTTAVLAATLNALEGGITSSNGKALVADDISINLDDPNGKIIVTFNNYGKTFEISGFQTSSS